MSEPTIEEFQHSQNCPCWSAHAILTCPKGCSRCTCPKLPAKAAPEDEAFEEWWHVEASYGTKADRAIAWEAWNARARLDAERSK